MARIYKVTDRIEVKIDDITVKLAPLTLPQKTEINQLMAQGTVKRDYKLIQEGITKSIQYSLKHIGGVEDGDGIPYKLTFDEQGLVTEECINDLYNLEMHKKLVMVCSSLVQSIPSNFTDQHGNPVDGVEFVKSDKGQPTDPN